MVSIIRELLRVLKKLKSVERQFANDCREI